LAVLDELWGGVVGVELDLRNEVSVLINLRDLVIRISSYLVHGGCDLEFGVLEQDLEVLDGEVGDTNVLNLAGTRELLHLDPGLLEVVVGEVLLGVFRAGRCGLAGCRRSGKDGKVFTQWSWASAVQ